MCDKKAIKAFTVLEVLLALSIWSLFIPIFSQTLLMFKKSHKQEEAIPLDCFTKILSYVKNGKIFELKNDCLVFKTLDTQKVYKISFWEKDFREKDEVFVPIVGLKQAVWRYWSSYEKNWKPLGEGLQLTPAIELELINEDDVCFETFIFNTACPYF